MRVPRIYADIPLEPNSVTELPGAAARHVSRVLRLSRDDPLIVFNGRGGEFAAQVDAATQRSVRIRVGAHEPREAEPRIEIGLAQAVSRGARMDYAIQKAVELGVAWIQPLTTQRSVVRLDRRRGAAKRAHWQSVAASACEQCGRNRIPLVHDVRELVQWIDTAPSNSLKLALTPHEGRGLDAFAPPRGPVVLLVGPEGGFAPPELEAASVGGFRAITMGPRVLRTETAAVAALTAVQVLWGDF